MKTATLRPFVSLTAAEVMSRDVVAIPQHISLRAAAHILANAHVTGAPVIDHDGVCVGVISSTDFVRRAEEEGLSREPRPIRTCPYQTQGRLLSGPEAVICTLAEGACALQEVQPTTGGRHTAVCRMPHDVLSDWQQVFENAPADEVSGYMTPNPVTVELHTSITALARMMLDAHIHRVVVVDHEGRPVGIVASTDVLAAVAYADPTM
jgi:CBS-domain-containing membrane protein